MKLPQFNTCLICATLLIGMPSTFSISLAQESSPTTQQAEPTVKTLKTLINEMGSIDYQTREDAMYAIWSRGPEIREELKQAADTTDNPEIQWRATEILSRFDLGIMPGAPEALVRMMTDYRRIQGTISEETSGKRLEYFDQLLNYGSHAYVPVQILIKDEQDPRYSYEMKTRLAAASYSFISDFLLNGDMDSAEKRLYKITRTGTPEAATNYVAFLGYSGKLEERLPELEKRVDGETIDQYILTLAYHALGNQAKAAEIAGLIDDRHLIETLNLLNGDYASLSAMLVNEDAAIRYADAADEDGVPTGNIRLNATKLWLAHLQNDADSVKRITSEMLFSALASQHQIEVELTISAFANIGKYDKTEKLIKNNLHATSKAIFYDTRFEYDEYFKLYKGLQQSSTSAYSKHHYALVIANQYAELGNRELAKKFIDATLLEMNLDQKYQFFSSIAEAYKTIDDRDALTALIFELIDSNDIDSSTLLTQLFYDQGYLAGFWWDRISEQDTDSSKHKKLSMITQLINGQLPEAQRKLLVDGQLRWLKNHTEEKTDPNEGERAFIADHYYYISQTYAIIGDVESEVAMLKKGAEMQPEYDMWYYNGMAKAYFDASMYDKVIQITEQMNESELNNLDAIAIRYAVYREQNKTEAAEKAYKQLQLGVLGNSLSLLQVARQLRNYLQFTASSQLIKEALPYQVLPIDSLTSMPHNNAAEQATVRLLGYLDTYISQVATPEDNNKEKLNRKQQSITLALLNGWSSESLNLSLFESSELNQYRTVNLVDAGKHDEAIALFQAQLEFSPRATDNAIELIQAFKKVGEMEKAEEVFQHLMKVVKPVVDKHPDYGMLLNNTAWVAAITHVGKDDMLKYARRSVKVNPNESYNKDTLAELEFIMGNIESAQKLMRECVKMEPNRNYYRAQLKRMEAGDNTVPCPRFYED